MANRSLLLVAVLAAVGCSSHEQPREVPGRRYLQVAEIPGVGDGLPVIVTREGCRIYVGAQMPLDSEGNLVGEDDLGAQTRQALENLRIALGGAGATMGDLVRLDVHLLSTKDAETVREILGAEFPQDRAPNQLILPTPELLPAGSLVQISGLAVVELRPEQAGVSLLTPETLPEPHGSAAIAVAQGEGWIYLSGIPDGALGAHEPISDMAEITHRSMDGLEVALKAAGASFAEVANSVVYISSLEQLERVTEVYRGYFPEGKVPPTSYVPRARSESAEGWIEIDMDAVIPAGSRAPAAPQFINPPELTEPTSYTQVVRVPLGRTIYVSAQTSLNSPEAETQTQAIYEKLQKMLEAAGAEFRHAVKVRIFPAGEGGRFVRPVRAKFYNLAAPPASTTIRSEGVPDAGARLQIDAIAVLPHNESSRRD